LELIPPEERIAGAFLELVDKTEVEGRRVRMYGNGKRVSQQTVSNRAGVQKQRVVDWLRRMAESGDDILDVGT